MGKKRTSPIAVIDIGSNEFRMKIAESSKNKLKFLDFLTYPLSLGRDTFDTGKISFEKVEKACSIIQNFLIVASEYNVKHIRTVATSAIREAENRAYILDQIKIKTGIDIEIIDDTTEKLYIYKLMMYLAADKYKKSALLVYIGSGNVGVAHLDQDKIRFMQNTNIGSLRVSELFTEVIDYSTEYYRVLEEYMSGFKNSFPSFVTDSSRQIIAAGHETATIAKLCDGKDEGIFQLISLEMFLKMYDEIKNKTVDRMFSDYNIPAEKAEVILPSMVLLKQLWADSKFSHIITPKISLVDSIIFEELYYGEFYKIEKDLAKSTLVSARSYARHYRSCENHFNKVEHIANSIFDKMKKFHGMGQREKLLLQTASILHDCGKFIAYKEHYVHSYNIVKASEIVGLSSVEKDIVANICLFHSKITPDFKQEKYAGMSTKTRVLISKLTAILRLADALDPSDEKKFDDVDIKIKENKLIITLSTEVNTDLEHWFFKQKSKFFEEVFGLKAILKNRRPL